MIPISIPPRQRVYKNNVYNNITTILIIIILIYDRDNQPPHKIHALKPYNVNTHIIIITPNHQNMLCYRHDFKALIRIRRIMYLRPRTTQFTQPPFEYNLILYCRLHSRCTRFILEHLGLLCRYCEHYNGYSHGNHIH